MSELREAKGRTARHKLPKYPADHELGMEVAQGGSNCDKCMHLAAPQTCNEKHFNQWNGGSHIPIKTSRYCCDFWYSADDED